MTYIDVWRERIAAGEATAQEAFDWLCYHDMDEIKAWYLLNG
tara:strand:- start:327 stop:452 length:126 start_codon:yes stop_codon:yes gene_type:complete